MQIEDRLDALLTTRLNGTQANTWMSIDDELLPLLQAADALAPLRKTQPRAEFVANLETRLLVYAASRKVGTDPLERHGDLTHRISQDEAPADVHAEQNALGRSWHRRTNKVWRPWQVVAAAILFLIVSASVLTAAAAASAGPGSLLFGLHRIEQNVRVQLASSQGDRVRLHLSYASEALSQLDSAVAHQSGDPAYSGALATFLAEQQAASDGLASLPPGTEYDALSTQLTTLRSSARSDLHASLRAITWTDRLVTTQALTSLGEIVLTVNNVKVTRENGQDVHMVRLVVTGNGFAPGAVAMVDGQQIGTLTSATTTQLVIEIDATTLHSSLRAIGVSNPDGTAALSPHIEIDNSAGQSGSSTSTPSHPTPVAHPTPTPKDGHGHGNGGGGGAGSGG